MVTECGSSQPFTGTTLVQDTGPVYQPTDDVTCATDVQFTGPVTQSVNKKSLPSFTGTAHFQDQDSDFDQYSEPTSPTQSKEEMGEVSDRKSQQIALQEVIQQLPVLPDPVMTAGLLVSSCGRLSGTEDCQFQTNPLDHPCVVPGVYPTGPVKDQRG